MDSKEAAYILKTNPSTWCESSLDAAGKLGADALEEVGRLREVHHNAMILVGEAEEKLAKQRLRIAELEEKIKGTYCAYCGREFPEDDELASQVTEHIYTCEKHPMRGLEQRIAELEAKLDEVRDG